MSVKDFKSVVELLRYRGQEQAEQKVFTFLPDGETEAGCLTYAQLDLRARSLASHLQAIGAAGKRAVLFYPFSDTLEFITAFFGCLYAGVAAVPAHPPRSTRSLSSLELFATDSDAEWVLTTSALVAAFEGLKAESSTLAKLDWLPTDAISSVLANDWQEPQAEPGTLAFLQYTSGSTGVPKGVLITHRNILHNSAMIYQFFGHSTQMKGVIWLPLNHDMGLIGGVLQPIYCGTSVVLIPPTALIQKPALWLQAISRYRATTSGGPNFAYDVACQKITPEQREGLDLSSWDVAFNGAEPVRAETLERFAQTFAPYGFRREAFYPCYGMAETTTFFSGVEKSEFPKVCHLENAALEHNRVAIAPSPHPESRSFVSCGTVGDDQRVLIIDPDTLKPCEADRIGEIWLSSPSAGNGYWNRPEETEKTFNAYLVDTGEGPFLRTGDLGFLLDGELYITGRLKDMLIIWGRNQYPQNIEATVQQSHPALRLGHGAAFAVEVNGEEQLVIAQEVERTQLRKLDVEAVITAIRRAIAVQYMVEAHAILLLKPASIPKTSSGKIRRRTCRDQFLEGSLEIVGEWHHNATDQIGVLELLIDADT